MSDFFQFELDFVESLRCIPMHVRLKLDNCGIKLKLAQWNHFSTAEREALVEKPCTTESEVKAYREFLQQLIQQHRGTADEIPVESHPAWMDTTTIPTNIQEKAKEIGAIVTPQQWIALTPVQRFALIKLSRSSHENENFLPAMQEFQLL